MTFFRIIWDQFVFPIFRFLLLINEGLVVCLSVSERSEYSRIIGFRAAIDP